MDETSFPVMDTPRNLPVQRVRDKPIVGQAMFQSMLGLSDVRDERVRGKDSRLLSAYPSSETGPIKEKS